MEITGNNPLLRIGLITDIHCSAESWPAASAELRLCLDCWRDNDVDVVMQLGDLIQGSEMHKGDELQQVLSLLKEFSGDIRHVIGNHCLALPRQALLEALGLHDPFYSFSVEGFRCIVLDGMDVSVLRTPETPEDCRILALFRAHPELHDYCGAVGIQQSLWLTRELEGAERFGERVIVFCHFPLLPETTDHKHGLLWNHAWIAELITSFSNVQACLSGHYHYGGYALYHGVHFVVFPAFVNRHEHPRFICGMAELHHGWMVIKNQRNETLYRLPFH